jgi:DNA-binding transcriptional ArsR family regulator
MNAEGLEKEIHTITSLIGDPVRSSILWNLLDNRAYTATELAVFTDTSLQNISMHLTKLVQADLLFVERQGRHKYFRFSKPEVAHVIEAIASLIPSREHKQITDNPQQSSIRYCRTCYDHLAGKVAVQITEALLKQKLVQLEGKEYAIKPKGVALFMELGINIKELKRTRRAFARPCLDWSERKHHLAGALGAAILTKFISLGYIRKQRGSRVAIPTSLGQNRLYELFKISV